MSKAQIKLLKDRTKHLIGVIIMFALITILLMSYCCFLLLKITNERMVYLDTQKDLLISETSRNQALTKMAKYGDSFDSMNSKYVRLKNGHRREEFKQDDEVFDYFKESDCMKLCKSNNWY